MKNWLILLFLLLITALFTGCLAITPVKQPYCERININMRICKDLVHKNHCRIYINRKKPYPDTVTERFWCYNTGYFGYETIKKGWERYKYVE